MICIDVQMFFISFADTPRSALRNPDVSAILGTGGRTPRYLNTPRTKGSLSMVSDHNSTAFIHPDCIYFACTISVVTLLPGSCLLTLQNLDDSDWTNSLYPSPLSGMVDTSFTDDVNMSALMLKEDDPGEAGKCLLKIITHLTINLFK